MFIFLDWNFIHPLYHCCILGARIQFQNFSSEDNHDFLEVRAGPQHSSALIGQFTGSQIPPVLLSTTHLTIIHFYSDHSENRPGFKLNYQGETESDFLGVFFVLNQCVCVCVWCWLVTIKATSPEVTLRALPIQRRPLKERWRKRLLFYSSRWVVRETLDGYLNDSKKVFFKRSG